MTSREDYLERLKAQLNQDVAQGAEEARKTMHDAFEKARRHFQGV